VAHPDGTEPVLVNRWTQVSGLVVGLQGLVVAAFAVFYLIDASDAFSLFNVVVSAALFVLAAGGLLIVARGLLAGRGWARSPALTWEIICLPVAYGLLQSGRWQIGLAVGLLSLLALVGLVLAPANRR
jgi:hypothetical protein